MSASAQTIPPVSTPDPRDADTVSDTAVHPILLVEEQAHVLRVIRLNLERCGYRVDAVMSADLAMQQARSQRYDALILTSDLPDMTSAQLCERMQRLLGDDDSGKSGPLILVGTPADQVWSGPLENREVLSRPVSLKLILARLKERFEADEQRGITCLN